MIPIVAAWPNLTASQLVGLDMDLDRIDEARALAEEMNRTDCMFMLGSADEIPWRDGYFEAIYTQNEPTAEIKRVLAPGGVIHQI